MADREFTDLDLANCAAREVQQRQRVYHRWVGQGKMKPDVAARQIRMMQQIERDYRERAENDPKSSGKLF